MEIGPSWVLTTDPDDRIRSRGVGEFAEPYHDHVDGNGIVVVGGTIPVSVASA